MARGKTLLSLLQQYRSEIRTSGNPAHNTGVRDSQIQLLQRTQEWLWEDYDWPHLRVRRDFSLQAGQRYYDTPSDMNIDRVEMLSVRYGEQWVPLHVGIDDTHFSTWDSDLDERSWPIERWQIYEDEQIEVWPMPADDADATTLEGTVRIVGIRNLAPLVADSDRADLDDRLIVMFAAAETLAAQGAPDASLKLQTAQRRFADLKANVSKIKSFSILGKSGPARKLKGPPRVHYRDRETS